MAETKPADLIKAIEGKKFAPVYLLMGEEAYYIDLITDLLEKETLEEGDKDFNLHIYYGQDVDLQTMVASAQQLPVMADRKVVILKEAQSMTRAKESLDKLEKYVAHPNPSTVLVVAFKGENLNATSKLMKAAAKSGAVICKSPAVRDYNLPAEVKNYCRQHNINIEEKAVMLLCDYIGNPLSKLFGELQKLLLINGGGEKKIKAADVYEHIGMSKDFNAFELSSAVASKDYPKAIRIIKYFEKNPKSTPTVMISATLFNFFSKLMVAHYTEKSEAALMKALNAKSSYALREIKDGLRNYTAMQTMNAIHHIREFDCKSKGIGSYQNEFALLGDLIFKLFT